MFGSRSAAIRCTPFAPRHAGTLAGAPPTSPSDDALKHVHWRDRVAEPNSSRISTYAKRSRNPFKMCTYKVIFALTQYMKFLVE